MATTSKSSSQRKPARTRPAGSSRSAELLLEIGTEELPYQFIAPALRSLQEHTEQLLKNQRLSFGTVRTIGTPRRLVLLVDRLAANQEPAVKEVMGPAKAVAFGQDGQPTRAAIGFATGQGVSVDTLVVRSTPKGEYVFAIKEEQGQPVPTVLAQHLPRLIGSLTFPKAMHWNQTGVRFARPIRWLVGLCHGKVLPVEYAGVTAASVSYGHRFAGPERGAANKGFPVRSIAQYLEEAERQGVIVEQQRRRTIILDQLTTLAKSVGGVLHPDEELVEQAVYSVEYPSTILGSFQAHYRSLPKEVLMTSMKEHQGFFALVDQSGALLPNFLAVTNMKLPDMRLIREGNERVLSARLADAKFFYDEDRKIKLEERLEKLKAVTFHQKLGNVFQRSMRIKALARYLAEQMGDRTLVETAERAAELCKADLLTGIVGEFPTLQGTMGGEYARHDGEPPDVARAIAEHYLPRGMEGEIPGTLAGRVLSLADRLDKIAGFFRAGIIPKGSEDPYALRRDALSIVRIIVESRSPVNISRALHEADDVLRQSGIGGNGSGVRQGPLDFIVERLRFYAGTAGGIKRDDAISAVLTPEHIVALSFGDLMDRMSILAAVTEKSDFDPLIIGFKRAHRLCEKETWDRKPVDSALFTHQAEGDLYQALQRASEQVAASMEQGDYSATLDMLVRMKEPVDAFFTGVMVNVEDAAVRANRLSLLKGVDELFLQFADFSQIVVQGQ
jgi:glycyl-tRNA synthetase beta chain